jgi:flagellar P-ring protein precursor FlgI
MLKYINKKCSIIFVMLICSVISIFAADAVRIKDIVTICGIRENQLTGIGLVVGLAGKGDSDKFGLTSKMLHNLTENYGFSLSEDDLKSKNVAAVMVTAKVSGFLRSGDSVNVTLSSIGDAKSLEGGILLQTALKGADGKIYAAAGGRLITGKKGSGTESTGSIPNGALVEQNIVSDFINDGKLSLSLKQPDFTTANAIKTAIVHPINTATPFNIKPIINLAFVVQSLIKNGFYQQKTAIPLKTRLFFVKDKMPMSQV